MSLKGWLDGGGDRGDVISSVGHFFLLGQKERERDGERDEEEEKGGWKKLGERPQDEQEEKGSIQLHFLS